MTTIQDIFKIHGEEFQEKYSFSNEQRKAFRNIVECRTDECGIHLDICEECGYEMFGFNSCRDRHCPLCQTYKKEEWINERKAEMLGTRYFHLVFTIPDDLNVITMQNKYEMYSILFKATSETLFELCSDKKWMGATPGFLLVLHTWAQNLDFHPHIHCIITGGGLTEINSWKSSGKDFFIHVKVLSAIFRAKFMYYLKETYEKGKLGFYGSIEHYNNKSDFQKLLDICYSKDWYTYAKKPFSGPEAVIEYLARYTHRVAISNNRIIKIEDGKVTFRWRDYRDGNKIKEMTLEATEFIRRFMLHVLPKGFMKIRYYGIIANRNKKTKLVLCQKLTQILNNPQSYKKLSKRELLLKVTGGKAFLCPCCGEKGMVRAGCLKLNDNST